MTALTRDDAPTDFLPQTDLCPVDLSDMSGSVLAHTIARVTWLAPM